MAPVAVAENDVYMKPVDLEGSSGPSSSSTNTTTITAAATSYNQDQSLGHVQSSKPSESDMLFYYKRLLPFKHIFTWLSHSPKITKDFTMREFAYEYRSGAYQRYNSYSSLDDFKQQVITANPTRFEIGAVYKVSPKERRNLPKQAMKAQSKELVFDIDLTDYDDIRTCCSGTAICTKCWKFIQVGAEILELALRNDFGFEHMVWVFSGRRGAHCWISDERARNLDEGSRRAIVEYLDVLGGKHSGVGSKGGAKLHVKKPMHPHVERSFEILRTRFIEIILEDQDPWMTHGGMKEEGGIDNSQDDNKSDNWSKVDEFLQFIPNKDLRVELKKKWMNEANLGKISHSREKWEDINTVASKVLKSQSQIAYLTEAKKDIIIYYLYPRLDVEVSRQVIHLLKSPFCIHPGTGNVCVPFDPKRNISGNSDDDDYGFNPMTAPNLKQLQIELEGNNRQNINVKQEEKEQKEDQIEEEEEEEGEDKQLKEYEVDRNVPSWERTSLKPYVDYFKKFVLDLVAEELKGEKRSHEQNNDPYDY